MRPFERLRQFLSDSFASDELRRLCHEYDPELERSLPGESVSHEHLAHEAAKLLVRRGLDRPFFALLGRARPRKAREIDEIAASFELSSGRSPAPLRLFLSCSDRFAGLIGPLVDALREQGITCVGDAGGGASASTPAEWIDALTHAHAFSCVAGEEHLDDPIRAALLTSAWVAALQASQARRRILVLQPHDVLDLRQLRHLSDVTVHALPPWNDRTALARAAAALADHLRGLDARPLGELHDLRAVPRWYPFPRTGSARFVGRLPQLWELHAMLSRSRLVGITAHGGPNLAQIRGLGGVGKTLLAVEYAHRFGSAWPGGIFWIDAEAAWASPPRNPAERLARRDHMLAGLAASLGVVATPGDLSATARAVERAIDERTGDRRHLWIVDNLPPGIDRASIEALLPASPAGALLLTTRWMALEALPNRLDLAGLDVSAARALLTSRRPPDGEAELAAAAGLAEDVGHHPLALDVLGALVRDELSTRPYADWRARLASPGDDFERRSDDLHEQLPTGCERAVTRVLGTSLALLKSELSRRILQVAALLADAPIPGDLLREILVCLEPVSDHDIASAIAELAAHALVTREPEVGGIRVHAVVRWVARRWPASARAPGLDLRSIEEQVCEVLCQHLRQADDIRQHAHLLQLLPHAEQVGRGASTEAVIVGASVGHFFEVRGEYHAARRYAERALEHFERTARRPNPYSALAKHNLGVALEMLGEPLAAQNYFGQALVDYQQLYGTDHPQTLMALHGLGTTFEAQGDYAAARRAYEMAHDGQRRVLDEVDPEALRSRMHMGATLSEQGDLAGARAILEPTCRLCERALGPEHPLTLDCWQFLALTLKRLGDLAPARALEERLLEARERLLGPEHPTTLYAAQQLAMTMSLQNDLPAAQALDERTLATLMRRLGPDHPSTLQTQSSLAVILTSQRLLERALPLTQQTLAGQVRVLGPRHPHTMITQENLAWIHQLRGELPRARELLEEVLAVREESLGPHCSDSHQARFKLAETLLWLGSAAAAEPLVRALESLRARAPEALSHSERLILRRLPRLEQALAGRRSRRRRRPPGGAA